MDGKMTDQHSDPFGRWRAQHVHLTPEEKVGMQRLLNVSLALGYALDELDVAEWWLEGKTDKEPDIVWYVSRYGYSRFVSGDWKSIPMEIPENEREDWRENSSFLVSVEEIREWEAGIVGGLVELLKTDQNRIIGLLLKQVDRYVAELAAYQNRPLQDFAPTQWDEDQSYEEEAGREVERLDKVFELTELLSSFEHGLELLRMLMISETDPEFGLPSKEYFDALMSIDSHRIMVAIRTIEPRLREILELWGTTVMEYSGKPYHRPYDDTAPEQFWWRHRDQVRLPRKSTPQNRRTQ